MRLLSARHSWFRPFICSRVFVAALLVATANCGNGSTGPVDQVATSLAFTIQPANMSAGSGISPAVAVTVQDASGNTVTTATTSITLAIGTNPASGTLSGTTTVAAVNGVATFSNLSINTAGTGYTLTAAATGLAGATSSAFNVSTGTASMLAFTVQPSNVTAGAAIAPAVVVAVQDESGSTVTTATNGITLALTGNPAWGTLSGTTTVAAVNGVAVFSDLRVTGLATEYGLTATATGLTGASSRAFTVRAAAASKLAFTVQPRTMTAGYTNGSGVQVSVQDAYGNTVPTATTSVTLAIGTNPSSATLSGTTTEAAVYGVAAFSNLIVSTAGTGYTFTATASGLSGATSAPFNVIAAVSFASVSAGGDHTCGVTTGGAGYCWGDNSEGELGTGPISNSPTPVVVSGGRTFVAVSAGSDFSCGVTTGGAGYCWAANDHGQLGNGSTTNSITPVPVSGGLSFASVSTGHFVALAYSCAVTPGGAAYCWGDNTFGQLGNGSGTSTSTPVAVAGGLTFAAVSAGGEHTCGVTTGGAAYCWGDNTLAQLGNGSGTSSSSTPVAVAGGLTFAAVSAGAAYGCGVTTGGAAYCWGTGPLGDGSSTRSSTPVAVAGGLTFAAVSAGGGHTCGVTTGGAAYCWGDAESGQLGNGSGSGVAPVPVHVFKP